MLGQLIKPMELLLAKAIPAPSDYFFQLKWDGIRGLVYINRGQIRIQNRKLHDRTKQYPEILEACRLLNCQNAILDGELVAFSRGKPSFAKVLQRELTSDSRKIMNLKKVIPIHFAAFDIIWINNKDLTGESFTNRFEILERLLSTNNEGILLTECFNDGKELFDWVRQEELEGIVAKEKGSPYIIGKRTKHWLKIKNRRSLLCIVCGISYNDRVPSSLMLGIYREDELYYIGRVGSGVTIRDLQSLTKSAQVLFCRQAPFVNPPKEKSFNVQWLKPFLTVIVEYAEWTDEGLLRQPTLLGFSTEKPSNAKV